MPKELTQQDQEEVERWMREDLEWETLPLCWGKNQTCTHVGTHILPGSVALYCVDCVNAILNN